MCNAMCYKLNLHYIKYMMKKLFLTVIAASITLSCAAQKKPKIKGDRNVTEIEKSNCESV